MNDIIYKALIDIRIFACENIEKPTQKQNQALFQLKHLVNLKSIVSGVSYHYPSSTKDIIKIANRAISNLHDTGASVFNQEINQIWSSALSKYEKALSK